VFAKVAASFKIIDSYPWQVIKADLGLATVGENSANNGTFY